MVGGAVGIKNPAGKPRGVFRKNVKISLKLYVNEKKNFLLKLVYKSLQYYIFENHVGYLERVAQVGTKCPFPSCPSECYYRIINKTQDQSYLEQY